MKRALEERGRLAREVADQDYAAGTCAERTSKPQPQKLCGAASSSRARSIEAGVSMQRFRPCLI
jgi:hypothetical protein